MNRLAFRLLASTALSCIAGAPAFSDVVLQNVTAFGASPDSPTIVGPGYTSYVGNLDSSSAAWFDVPSSSSVQLVELQFIAARLTSTSTVVPGPEGEGSTVVTVISPVDSLNGGTVLPVLQGNPNIVPGSVTGPTLSLGTGSYEGASYPTGYGPSLNLTVPHTTTTISTTQTVVSTIVGYSPSSPTATPEGGGGAVPIYSTSTITNSTTVTTSTPVTFADVVPPDFTAFASGPEGLTSADSFTVDVTLQPGQSLPFSFAYEFDYVLNVDVATQESATNVPEPASLGLLGAGLAGAAAMRRRRRRVL